MKQSLTTRVWLKILTLMALIAIPLLFAQYRIGQESASVVFDMTTRVVTPELYDDHMKALRTLGDLNPGERERYREAFLKTAAARQARDDLVALKGRMMQDLQRQSLLMAVVVLVISLAASFWISRSIVDRFRKLADDNARATRRLDTLRSLESWQATAKTLVHELKGFLMPVKLIATDLETKHATLPPEAFTGYLRDASGIIRHQTQSLESMIESFTRFGKLPPIAKERLNIDALLNDFAKLHQPSFDGRAVLSVQSSADLARTLLDADPRLLTQLLFNIVNNAVEANIGRPISVTLNASRRDDSVMVRILNNGAPIPAAIAPAIFDVHVSTKSSTGRSNMGLGLAVAKKIALDHGGDLTLGVNDETQGVGFDLEIPIGSYERTTTHG